MRSLKSIIRSKPFETRMEIAVKVRNFFAGISLLGMTAAYLSVSTMEYSNGSLIKYGLWALAGLAFSWCNLWLANQFEQIHDEMLNILIRRAQRAREIADSSVENTERTETDETHKAVYAGLHGRENVA